jgi:hypothetical protein
VSRLIVACLIGAAIGVIVGYFVYAVPDATAPSFGYWIRHPFRYSAIYWAVAGAVIGAGLQYLRAKP